MRASVARTLLRAVGLPTLEPPVDTSSKIDALRARAMREDVLFHGSLRADLEVLEPIRMSTDTTQFGNLQAVFATSDPVWATWFAIVGREGLTNMTNGSMAPAGASLYPRWYFFAVNEGALAPGRFRDGYLYVLPRATFRLQPPVGGLLDTAQWASDVAVRPVERIPVSPADFPLLDQVFEHVPSRFGLKTILRAGRRARRTR
jgi:hypothetical protein